LLIGQMLLTARSRDRYRSIAIDVELLVSFHEPTEPYVQY